MTNCMNSRALSAIVVAVAVSGAYCLLPRTSHTPAAQGPTADPKHAPAAAVPAIEAAVAPLPLDLAMGCEQKSIVADFIGNGRDRMKVMLMNKGTAPLHVTVPVGQMFESDRNMVIAIRPAEVDVDPGKSEDVIVQTAATHSTNTVAENPYQLSYANIPRLEPLLTYVQTLPEVAPGAVQTAVLALLENLPLSAVAKFTLASTPLPSRFNTDAFRSETCDIMSALTMLRDLRVKDDSLAMTIDQQLKIEAMIDPNARPLAMRYYAIDPEREWDFWRNELLNGEPCTRHYALYGIARFYPEVALQMLPRWAYETRTNPVYRLSAVQALADTQRSEALPILRGIADTLGKGTELGKAATGAADYLDYRLVQIASTRNTVAFRTTSGDYHPGGM